jgi:hypothetical protein
MGLLEYHHAMPSLHDVTHDGCLCTFTIWKFHQLTTRQLLSGQPRLVLKRQAIWPVHHVPDHSPPASQADRRVAPAL